MDWLVEVESDEHLRSIAPDFEELKQVDARGVIVTAPGSGRFDFVSRFFAPRAGIREDRNSVADNKRVEVECEQVPQARAQRPRIVDHALGQERDPRRRIPDHRVAHDENPARRVVECDFAG